jgi:hypothetical protein
MNISAVDRVEISRGAIGQQIEISIDKHMCLNRKAVEVVFLGEKLTDPESGKLKATCKPA